MVKGQIPCGADGKCGGKDGALGDGPTMNNTLVKLTCMSGVSDNSQYPSQINTNFSLTTHIGSAYIDSNNKIKCTDPSTTTSTTTPSTPTITVYPATHQNSTPTGPIVGGTVGGLATIFAAGLLWYCCRRATGTATAAESPGNNDNQIPADDVVTSAAATPGPQVRMLPMVWKNRVHSLTNRHWT